MGIQYLVDYENVHEIGICGMDALSPEDNVYIFHTCTTEKIRLSVLDDVQAWVKVILVPQGNQSLDMHLGSFLGYLIGKEENPETQYAIVSHDSDYRGISDFWNNTFRGLKVQCIHGMLDQLYPITGEISQPLMQESTRDHFAIREFILKAFMRHGTVGMDGLPCMQVSELCTLLNNLPAYNRARKKTGKKPLHFLNDECSDIVLTKRKWQQDWVYLIGEKDEDERVDAIGEPEPSAEPESDGLPADAGESTTESDEGEIMEMGDLTIDEELLVADCSIDEAINNQEMMKETESEPTDEKKETEPTVPVYISADQISIKNMELSDRTTKSLIRAGYKTAGNIIYLSDKELLKTRNLGRKGVNEIRTWVENQQLKAPSPSSESEEKEIDSTESADKPIETNFLSAAREFLQKTDETNKNSRGDKRVSVLRDELLKLPEFREALKESELKPIPFIQQLFAGEIAFYREKGIWWVTMKNETENKDSGNTDLSKRREKYYQKAFTNVQKMLTEAGLEKNVADEIADIFTHSNTAVEPRKAMHNLLCQRFGTKIGAKYYRKAIKYTGL